MEVIHMWEAEKGRLQLDPRTKLVIFLASGMMSLNSYSDVSMLVYSFTICLVFALCNRWGTAIKAGLLFLLLVYLRAVMEASQNGAAILVLIVSAVTTCFLFGFPVVMSILLLVKTTRVSQFLSALSAMHLPVRLIVPLAVFFRFLPTVVDEWNGIRKAMAFRGISLSPASVLRHPGKTVEYILVPLLFSCVGVMEEMAAAAMARGMDLEQRRSSYEEVRLCPIDYLVMALFLGMIILALVVGRVAKGGRIY